jgi:hypothetical protein
MRTRLVAAMWLACVFSVHAQKQHLTEKQTQQRDDLQRWVMNNVDPWKPWDAKKFVAVLGPYEKRQSPEKPVWDAYYFPKADSTVLVARQMNVMMMWRFGKATQ